MSRDNWCAQCGTTLHESVSSCADHGKVCCVCECKAPAHLAVYVGDLMPGGRGDWACEDCGGDVIAESHLDEESPCTCWHCEQSRSRSDARLRAAYVARVGGLSRVGLRLVGELFAEEKGE